MTAPATSIIGRHRHRLHWIALYAVICVIEYAVTKAKEYVGRRIVEPPPKQPGIDGDSNAR